MRQEQRWGQWHQVVLRNPELTTACSSQGTAAGFSHLPLRRAQTGESKNWQFSCPQTSSWLNRRFSANETIVQLFRTKFRAVFITKMILLYQKEKESTERSLPKCWKSLTLAGLSVGFLFVCLFIFFSFVWHWTCVFGLWALSYLHCQGFSE